MQIVPVIDLRQNLVVHALTGDRENYKPIDSKISSSAKPIDVINGYLELLNFKSLYIADLDALEQLGNNTETINLICDQYPNIEIWLDCGTSLAKEYLQNKVYANLRIILSSESINSISTFTHLLKQFSQHAFILSLDFKANKLLGTNDLFNYMDQWPNDVIVLNLNNVGSNQGIKYPSELVSLQLANNFNLYYGGGIRNTSDINKLEAMNFTGALISTALHTNAITSDEISIFSQPP